MMIVVPAWIAKEEPKGIWAVLGSEPKADAEPEWIPQESIQNCLYGDLTSPQTGRRIALLLMDKEKLPEKIRSILEGSK